MNVNEIEARAKAQAEISEVLNQIQETYKVDRKTAIIVFRASCESVIRAGQSLVKAGASGGPIAMLKKAQTQINGSRGILEYLKDETL